MLCPVCRHDNFEGEDTCTNCGADLSAADLPQPAVEFHDTILGSHLDALRVGEPSVVEAGITVAEALRRMHDAGTDCLLVRDGDRLVGIFTDRDAVVRVAGKRMEASRIAEVMTPKPVTLRHDDPIALAIHRMAVGGFRHIPILQNGKPTGVVTARDVFHHLAEAFG